MKSSVHPFAMLSFLSVVALIVEYQLFLSKGALLFLIATVLLAAAVGWFTGRRWKVYPWQIGLLSAIPSVAFILWRFYTQQTAQDEMDNLSLFIFHPLLVAITGHFGGFVGRWQALKARASGNGTA